MNNLIAWWNIGWSASWPDGRNVGRRIKQDGWAGFVRDQVMPAVDAGVTRVMLHNPFGAIAGEDMQFDQYLHARDAGLDWLTEGFVEAWKPLTKQGVQLICYLGALRNDPDFDPEDGIFDDFDRLSKSTAEIRRAGCDYIVMDATSSQPKNSMADQYAKWLEQEGITVGSEPRPTIGMDHWAKRPSCAIHRLWYRTSSEVMQAKADAARAAGNLSLARTEDLNAQWLRERMTTDADNAGAEVILLQVQEADQESSATTALADGYSVAVGGPLAATLTKEAA